MAAKEFVESTVNDNTVAMFSKTYCPYCKAAKNLFKSKYPSVKVQVIELDERDDGGEIQNYLHEKTGQRSVPNIFVNQQHVGGNDDTQAAAKNGTLDKLLAV